MKNVWILILFGLLGAKGFGQDLQNANWYFGNQTSLSFLPNINSPILSSGISQMVSTESCASVSDRNGNLLFYTDGIKVWDRLHNVMPNGVDLKGNTSSFQGAIIVPCPNTNYKYFIVTISGATDTGSSLPRGLFYSEVDMSLNNGLGDVILSNKNTNLQDENSFPINDGNMSERLTYTKHSNGKDYWVITQIKDKVYSYLVTNDGISLTPAKKTNAPYNTDTGGSAQNVINPAVGCIKISPDFQKIAITYRKSPDGPYNNGQIILGNFNNTTGEVTLNANTVSLPDNIISIYGVEFSPSSQYLYFGSRPVYRITNTGQQLTLIWDDYPGGDLSSAGLQRGIDGQIYVIVYKPSTGSRIGVINNPDSNNAIFNDNYLPPNVGSITFPQWVYLHESSCLAEIFLYNPDNVTNGISNKQASKTILASNTLTNQSVAIYHAGEDVVLLPGFYVDSGSHFRGYIEGCSGEFEARIGNFSQSEEKGEEYYDEETITDLNFFTIAPNPANSVVTITGTEAIQSILITSLDGKILYSNTLHDKTNSFDVVIDGYSKGMYNVTVIMANGEVETQKLVKN